MAVPVSAARCVPLREASTWLHHRVKKSNDVPLTSEEPHEHNYLDMQYLVQP